MSNSFTRYISAVMLYFFFATFYLILILIESYSVDLNIVM